MWDILGYSGIFWDIWSRMFFQKDPPQTEGRRDADLLIKTSPDLLLVFSLLSSDIALCSEFPPVIRLMYGWNID